jgi:DNA modification methylase
MNNPVTIHSLAINEIYCGDARDLMQRIEPESIAASIWSPPYYVGKDYEKNFTFDQWRDLLASVIDLHSKIIIKGGFLVINIADILCYKDKSMPRIQLPNPKRHKIRLNRKDILAVKEVHPEWNRVKLAYYFGCSEQTIDRRLNGNNIRGGKYNVQTRVLLTGGMIQDMAAKSGFYLYDRRIWIKDPCWQNSKWHSISYRAVDEFEYLYIFWKPGETKIDRYRLSKEQWRNWGSRAVWKIPSVRVNDRHEAMFPVELPRRAIQLLTAPGDTILDPFLGSGSSAIAAIMEGRNFIGIELLENYAELARDNIKNIKAIDDKIS